MFECDHRFRKGEIAFGCRRCNYDLCATCYQGKTTPFCSHSLSIYNCNRKRSCNECDRDFQRGESVYGCKMCHYDQCEQCHKAKSAVSSRVRVACAHALACSTMKTRGFTCGECCQLIEKGELVYRCDQCDHDRCGKCQLSRTVVKPLCTHALSEYTCNKFRHCDECDRDFWIGERVYGCKICQYDQCKKCHRSKAGLGARGKEVCTHGLAEVLAEFLSEDIIDPLVDRLSRLRV